LSRYDAVIIGSGPAGLEAALNLRIRQKNFLLFGSRRLSAKLELAPKIENYLGFPAISGQELKSRFEAHLSAVSVEIVPEQVSMVYPMGGYFAIATSRRTVEATVVLLCLGVHNAKELPGERAFLGRGVSYCATCDAPLYKGKMVAIIGDSDDAVEEANFMAGIAAKVYYIPGKRGPEGLSPPVEVVSGIPREIAGEGKVRRLVLATGVLAVDGVFLLRDTIAPASLVPGLETRDGFISVDADMRTKIPGLYAAGDCTGKPHQYMRAAGQGQTAALNAVAYLDRIESGK
jgi:thioredoxin reductase (NADPH)